MLEAIIITLLIATFLNVIFKKIQLPTIVGYIITGIIVNYGFNFFNENNTTELHEFAEFGVVFLMFTIGLEFSVEHLTKMRKEVFVYGALQVTITTLVLGAISHYLFGMEPKGSIIIGAALSLASTAVILKVFNETGENKTTYGKNTIGILIFQDIAVIPILLMITIFTSENTNLTDLLSKTAVSAAALLGIMLVIGRKLLNPFFRSTLGTSSQEIFLGSIFLIVLGASFVAHKLGFSYSLGAFMAGMLISETHFKHQVEADLIPFRELLLGVFFITVGLQLDISIIVKNSLIIFCILPTLILIKGIIVSLILIGQRTHNIVKTSLVLAGLGEFGLVIIDLAQKNNLVSLDVSQIISVTIILSLFTTPLVMNQLQMLTNFIACVIFRRENKSKIKIANDFSNHAIIIGYGRLGQRICSELKYRGIDYIVIEGNQTKFELGKKNNEPIILGNGTQKNILEIANIKNSTSVFISVGNSRKIINICSAIRALKESASLIVKVHSYDEKTLLKSEFTHSIKVIVETEETAKVMIEAAKIIDNED